MRRQALLGAWLAALLCTQAAPLALAQNPAAPASPAQTATPAQAAAPAPAAPAKPLQSFDSVLNPNAAEQARRQQVQPGNNSPVWREVRSEKSHYTTDRGPEAGVLIQSGG